MSTRGPNKPYQEIEILQGGKYRGTDDPFVGRRRGAGAGPNPLIPYLKTSSQTRTIVDSESQPPAWEGETMSILLKNEEAAEEAMRHLKNAAHLLELGYDTAVDLWGNGVRIRFRARSKRPFRNPRGQKEESDS